MEWRSHPLYQLDADISGAIRNSKTLRVRKTRLDHEGYARINFWWGGRLITRKICSIVAEAWHGLAPFAGAEVCHGPEGLACDAPRNLRWGTHEENLIDRRRGGKLRPHKRLSSDEITMILTLVDLGKPKISVARQFQTSPSNIRHILHRPR